MKTFPKTLLLVVILVSLAFPLTACNAPVRPLPAARHTRTEWLVQTSLPFEAIAFLNALTHDPLVTPRYPTAIRHFQAMYTPEVEQALSDLTTFRDETLHAHLSGFLFPFFLAGEAETLDDLIALTENPDPIKAALQAYDDSYVEINVYYGEQGWKWFEETLPSLKVVFEFLRDTDFAGYWETNFQANVQKEQTRVEGAVAGYNIVPEIEANLGFGLPSDQVTIYLVHFLWPYGHHLIGTSFATVPEDTNTGVIRSTVHELLHNPFNNTDPAFWKAINTLQDDPVISEIYEGRNQQYGYNNWGDYVAEDSVRALEQGIEMKLNLGRRWNWAEDGGMHTLAEVLFELMAQEGFPKEGEGYQAFILRMANEGKLSPENIQLVYEQMK